MGHINGMEGNDMSIKYLIKLIKKRPLTSYGLATYLLEIFLIYYGELHNLSIYDESAYYFIIIYPFLCTLCWMIRRLLSFTSVSKRGFSSVGPKRWI